MNKEDKQDGGREDTIHNKFKNLVVPAGLALFTDDDIITRYDIIHRNEPIHDSLYDRLLELASYNSNIDDVKKDKKKTNKRNKNEDEDEDEKEKEDKENIKLTIQPVSPPAAVTTEVFKTKKTKRNKIKPTIKHMTRRRKRVF